MVNINEKRRCCGCSACEQKCPQKAISMVSDNEGYIYPYVDESKCIKCSLCEKICPFQNPRTSKSHSSQIYAVKNKDSAVRYHSSSGGVFYSLAKCVLNNDGIVCGVMMREDCRSAQHIIVDSTESLNKLQGSKYIQSAMGAVYTTIQNTLNKNKYVLFSGTPCQVNGLKNFLMKDYENLLCVEMICHGVPSVKLWNKYVDELEKNNKSSLKNVYFRSKKYSWDEFGVLTEYANKKTKFHFSFEDPYFRMFNSNFCLRPSCYNCKAKGGARSADISLGDFWHIRDVIPSFDDNKGVSMVMLNTQRGKEFFEKIKDRLVIADTMVDYHTALKCNPAINGSMKKPLQRDDFYIDVDLLDFNELEKKYIPKTLKIKLKSVLIKCGLWQWIQKVRGN